ncbi:hypothetical protein GF327_04390, partial [Candidatus Woesearchaeota archaeon]|nr:hypothetical protein [Candidatus Woesearchaeota archaeon]
MTRVSESKQNLLANIKKNRKTIEKLKSQLSIKDRELQELTKKIKKIGKESKQKAITEFKERKENVEIKTKAAIQFQRWQFYITFIQTIFGFYLAKTIILKEDAFILITVIFIFGPLLYGGIYTLNDIFDQSFDKKNPKKKHRPLVAQLVSQEEALVFSLISILTGMFLTFYLFPDLVVFTFAFLLINILYSFKLKHIPVLD